MPEEHKLFLQVIHGQKNVKSLRELLMLMKAADRLECLPMQQAICVVTILKLQQILRDCEQEDRRRLLPYVYKILSHYNGKSIFFLILAANLKFFFQIFKVKVSVFKILSHFIGK